MRRLLTIAISTVLMIIPAISARAVPLPDVASQLDPWHLTGSLFVGGGASGAATYDISPQCRNFHLDRRAYQSATPWDPPPTPKDIIEGDLVYSEWLPLYQAWDSQDLASFVEWAGWDPSRLLPICNRVHKTGWIPVSADYIETNTDGLGVVEVNVTGPATCDSGYLLMGSATYWFNWYDLEWSYHYGTDWTEDYSGPGITVSGELTTQCELIAISSGDDFASIAESVPTGQSNVNPTVDGLTGLDTWLWYDFAEREASELGPYVETINAMGTTFTLTVHAWVDKVMWDPDCVSSCNYRGPLEGFDISGYDYELDFADGELFPAATYDGGADTEDLAAAIHVYETKDDYTVSTATIWTGFYTYEGVNYPYAPVVIANALPYVVHEIRATPTGP